MTSLLDTGRQKELKVHTTVSVEYCSLKAIIKTVKKFCSIPLLKNKVIFNQESYRVSSFILF